MLRALRASLLLVPLVSTGCPDTEMPAGPRDTGPPMDAGDAPIAADAPAADSPAADGPSMDAPGDDAPPIDAPAMDAAVDDGGAADAPAEDARGPGVDVQLGVDL